MALRDALGPRLTPAVRARPKHPFMAPPARDLPLELLRGWLHEAPLPLAPGAVQALLTRWPTLSNRERVAWDPVLWTAVSAALLGRRYGL